MQDTTMNEILALISKLGPVSAAQLAVRLNLTPADIRYQLARLTRLNLIVKLPADRISRKGRPAARYMSASGAGSSGDNPILISLLSLLPEVLKPESYDQLSAVMAAVFELDKMENLGRIQQILALVEILQRKGYQASWEARPDAPLIILNRCPYLTWLQAQPACCEFDRTVLALAFNHPVKKIRTRIDRIDLPCQFSIKI